MSSKTIMLLLEEFEGIYGLRLIEEPSGNPFEPLTVVRSFWYQILIFLLEEEVKEKEEENEDEEEGKEESNEEENEEKEEESDEEENDEKNKSENKKEKEENEQKKKIRDERGKEFPEISSKQEESTIELTVSTKLAQRDVIASTLLLLNHDFVSTLEWKRE
uniref:Uncharacterized protein n=1 Tax=Vespula pensylvanica TaxID=30213 RepID=A0A834UCY6_VESPE|nr:hypothetical protein H0235_004401 [Vespula pensylvanica]